MEQSIETTPLNLVHQVLSGTRNRRQSIYRRRKRKHTMPWEVVTDLHATKVTDGNGHVDLLC